MSTSQSLGWKALSPNMPGRKGKSPSPGRFIQVRTVTAQTRRAARDVLYGNAALPSSRLAPIDYGNGTLEGLGGSGTGGRGIVVGGNGGRREDGSDNGHGSGPTGCGGGWEWWRSQLADCFRKLAIACFLLPPDLQLKIMSSLCIAMLGAIWVTDVDEVRKVLPSRRPVDRKHTSGRCAPPRSHLGYVCRARNSGGGAVQAAPAAAAAAATIATRHDEDLAAAVEGCRGTVTPIITVRSSHSALAERAWASWLLHATSQPVEKLHGNSSELSRLQCCSVFPEAQCSPTCSSLPQLWSAWCPLRVTDREEDYDVSSNAAMPSAAALQVNSASNHYDAGSSTEYMKGSATPWRGNVLSHVKCDLSVGNVCSIPPPSIATLSAEDASTPTSAIGSLCLMTVHSGNSTSSPPMCHPAGATSPPEEPAVMLSQAGIPSECIGPPGGAADMSPLHGCWNMVPYVPGSSCDEQLTVIDSNTTDEATASARKASPEPSSLELTAGALSCSLEPSPTAERSGTGLAGRWDMDPTTPVVTGEDPYASGSSAAAQGACGTPPAAPSLPQTLSMAQAIDINTWAPVGRMKSVNSIEDSKRGDVTVTSDSGTTAGSEFTQVQMGGRVREEDTNSVSSALDEDSDTSELMNLLGSTSEESNPFKWTLLRNQYGRSTVQPNCPEGPGTRVGDVGCGGSDRDLAYLPVPPPSALASCAPTRFYPRSCRTFWPATKSTPYTTHSSAPQPRPLLRTPSGRVALLAAAIEHRMAGTQSCQLPGCKTFEESSSGNDIVDPRLVPVHQQPVGVRVGAFGELKNPADDSSVASELSTISKNQATESQLLSLLQEHFLQKNEQNIEEQDQVPGVDGDSPRVGVGREGEDEGEAGEKWGMVGCEETEDGLEGPAAVAQHAREAEGQPDATGQNQWQRKSVWKRMKRKLRKLLCIIPRS